jgi:regulator of sirC expression with transglutaminase-like and TPR domain
MSDAHDAAFQCRSLSELLRHPLAHEEHAAIWIARDAHGTLVPRDVLAQLDALADDFDAEDLDELDASEQATALIHHVALRHGFGGNERNYYDAENSYIDSVLRRKHGIPISLAVIYLAIARRVEITAYPVGFPGHFLVRVGERAPAYVDPFEGKILRTPELLALAGRALGPDTPLKPEYLAPISISHVAQRMLHNLKRVHEGQRDYARALLVCDRLIELAPTPELRRDRGLFALRLGAHRVATTDLAHYLLKRPNAKDVKDVRAALAKSRRSEAPLN